MRGWAWISRWGKVHTNTIRNSKEDAEDCWDIADDDAESLGDLINMGYKLKRVTVIVEE